MFVFEVLIGMCIALNVALSNFRSYELSEIQLLFTDLVMPKMDGKELSKKSGRPTRGSSCFSHPVMSDAAILQCRVMGARVTFIHEPPHVLASKVREVLDKKR